jgi:hypothetical protein
MPDINQALSECRETLARILKALHLEYEIVTDEDVEEPNLYIEAAGVGMTLEAKEEKQHPCFDEAYQKIEYTVYVVHYIPGTWHEPPDCDVDDVLTTPHMGAAVKALVLQIVDGIIELEFECMSDEQMREDEAGMEAAIERQKLYALQDANNQLITLNRVGMLSDETLREVLEEEHWREMLCTEVQDVY